MVRLLLGDVETNVLEVFSSQEDGIYRFHLKASPQQALHIQFPIIPQTKALRNAMYELQGVLLNGAKYNCDVDITRYLKEVEKHLALCTQFENTLAYTPPVTESTTFTIIHEGIDLRLIRLCRPFTLDMQQSDIPKKQISLFLADLLGESICVELTAGDKTVQPIERSLPLIQQTLNKQWMMDSEPNHFINLHNTLMATVKEHKFSRVRVYKAYR